jgi:hypothetical protein
VDLSKIDRTIAKEPVYQTKTPKYCLLVFGPEAKTRMWLVLDGKVMYVDRNGNGDLTGADEQVPPNPKNGRFVLEPFTAAGIEYAHMGVWVWKNDRVQIALFRKEELEHRKKLPLSGEKTCGNLPARMTSPAEGGRTSPVSRSRNMICSLPRGRKMRLLLTSMGH